MIASVHEEYFQSRPQSPKAATGAIHHPFPHMQELLKRLLGELHTAYFKPNGFRKEQHRFRRDVSTVMQQVEFQSSSWNSSGGPVTFYINISVGFTDIPMADGKPALTGSGRIGEIISDAPSQFDLSPINYERVRADLLTLLPLALSELSKHYDDVRSRAQSGFHAPIPLPENWRVLTCPGAPTLRKE